MSGHAEKLSLALREAGVEHELIRTETNLAAAEDGAAVGLGHLSEMAPSFVLRTKEGNLAAIVRGDTRLSYKKIKKALGLKDVSLASLEEVRLFSGAEPGCVPLVIEGARTLMDQRLLEREAVYGGTGAPGITLKVSPSALAEYLRAEILDIAEPKGG